MIEDVMAAQDQQKNEYLSMQESKLEDYDNFLSSDSLDSNKWVTHRIYLSERIRQFSFLTNCSRES